MKACCSCLVNSVISASSECETFICSLFCGSNPMWCAESATALAVHSPSDPLFFWVFFSSYHEKQTRKQINIKTPFAGCMWRWSETEVRGSPYFCFRSSHSQRNYGPVLMCLAFIQLRYSGWAKSSHVQSFVRFKPGHPLVRPLISANGTQEPLNQQTNHRRILSQSIRQDMCVCACSVPVHSLFVHCQTRVTAAGFWVRAEQTQLTRCKSVCVGGRWTKRQR